MVKKKYSSYAQIELELEILKFERQLNLKKLILNVDLAKESLKPKNLIISYFGDYKSILSNYSGFIMKIGVPLFINWITNRKRGY